MARLLRLHLTCVGHKDARFFPLTLDFRARNGAATDNVVWLRNGGGKSSLLNLFYSTFLPESRKFLGSKAESRERRMADYVKATDLACIISEWEMPPDGNLFSNIRIVGQALAWRGGVASLNDEERLDREFFTFRGSDKMPFDSLPIHGLGPEPKRSLQELREWLVQLTTDNRAIEVERGNQGKAKWRQQLDAVGFDTELFNYQLAMNVREGGAAELFKVRDTMEFIDQFLEMALHPLQAEKTADQIESVREKLRKLPQRELEEKFIASLLGELRLLEHEAVTLDNAQKALLSQQQSNELLRVAIQDSIEFRRAKLSALQAELVILEQQISDSNREKLAKQEYRLNYDNLFKQLTHKEALVVRESCQRALDVAARLEKIAEAAIRFAEIRGKESELNALVSIQNEILVTQKPILDELRMFGAHYSATLGGELIANEATLSQAKSYLSKLVSEHKEADGRLKTGLQTHTRLESELAAINQRLVQRDLRRADLRTAGIVESKEKALSAIDRWKQLELNLKNEIEEREVHAATIEAELAQLTQTESGLALKRQSLNTEASTRDDICQRGFQSADILRKLRPIIEVTSSDAADLDQPDLLILLRSRESKLLDSILQARVDGEDDKRILHSIETDRLFPPSREVEITVEYLQGRGIRTAMPAYRFLAANVPKLDLANKYLTDDPARFSGIVVTSPTEFETLGNDPLKISGLRHPVVITLSELPEQNPVGLKTAVALPGSAGAFHYDAAAQGQADIETRLEKLNSRLLDLERSRLETTQANTLLEAFSGEFGNGRLLRFAEERDQLRLQSAQVTGQIQDIGESKAKFLLELSLLIPELKQARVKLTDIATVLERLNNYFTEHEQHEQLLISNREERQTAIREAVQAIATEELSLEELLGKIEPARESVNLHEQQRSNLIREQQEIAYQDAQPDGESLTLEATRARYKVSLARFEERFGQSKLDGQIEEKRNQLSELRISYGQDFKGLDQSEIEIAAQYSDRVARREKAKSDYITAHGALEEAKRLLKLAEANLPAPRAHKQGLGLPPQTEPPQTASEAVMRRDELDGQIAEVTEKQAKLTAIHTTGRTTKSALEGNITAREPLLTTLDGLTAPATGMVTALPDDDQAVATLVREAKSQIESLNRKHTTAQSAANARIQTLIQISRRDEFAALPQIARERFVALQQAELLARCFEFIQGYEARSTVLRNEIDTLVKDKDIVVRQLDGVATTALRLLGQAERASIMPDSFPGWSGLSFLRISTQPVTEPAARRDRLAALVDRLVNEKAIPRGAALACAAVREVGGLIRATLLKPEDPLRPDRHDITEFAAFSGGEKMTAAILLYVTLAQLRSRGRHEHGREREAGVLILDNPLGTASKRDFVELQLRVARQMGVQLIFTTGVNDLGALEVLPRILRLRKRHRDIRTGDLLLSQDPAEEHIEGVQANLRA